MRILFFGDTFGRPGRDAIKKALPEIRREHVPDFVIVNGENFTHGRGIQAPMAYEFLNMGVDLITTGNHVWDQKGTDKLLNDEPRVIRPLNFQNSSEYPCPGNGSAIIAHKERPSIKLGVIQVIGRVMMDDSNCPFLAASEEVERMKKEGVRHIFVDMHAEATSEKQAIANYLDGRVGAVVGTHTHVPTADERILPGGTAAITDVGMCGCFDSVIGVRKEISIRKFLTKQPVRYEPAEGPGGYNAVLVDLDPKTGLAEKIQRLHQTIC